MCHGLYVAGYHLLSLPQTRSKKHRKTRRITIKKNAEEKRDRNDVASVSGPEWVVRLSICSNLADNRRHDQSYSRWFGVRNSQNADEDIQILYDFRKNLDDSRTCHCASNRARARSPKHHDIFHFMVYIFCEFDRRHRLAIFTHFFLLFSLPLPLDGSKLSAANGHWTQRIRMRIECYIPVSKSTIMSIYGKCVKMICDNCQHFQTTIKNLNRTKNEHVDEDEKWHEPIRCWSVDIESRTLAQLHQAPANIIYGFFGSVRCLCVIATL